MSIVWLDRVRELRRMRQTTAAPSVPESELAWQVEVFRAQIPPTGPIGYLHATPRSVAHDTPGNCGSCGEPMEDGQRFCCRACARAKETALNLEREAVN